MLEFDTLKINLGLERMQKILATLGNPHLKFKSIHVAGTNGKGSVCAMLDSILREAGYKVGLFTSPHLFSWCERIKVNGKDIKISNLKSQNSPPEADPPSAEKIEKIARELSIDLTPFEQITAVAFNYFADQGVDIAVVEVGLGGRLDATNVIDPLVSVITNIDYDHIEYLGNTLSEIAHEKAGIIKYKVPVVTAEKKVAALNVIKKRCKENKSKCWVVNDDADLDIKSPMLGSHQRINEAVAVKVAQLLKINKSAIKTGLQKTYWPGRCQIVSKDPFIIVDGAHNAAGARALSDTIEELKIPRPRTLILGVQAYKDINGILDAMVQLADRIIVTRSSHPQAANLEEIARRIDGKPVILINSVVEAVAVARGFGHPVIVAGSLFVAAEVLTICDAWC